MSSPDVHPPALDPHVVDGSAKRGLVEANAGLEVELPAVSGAAEDAPAF